MILIYTFFYYFFFGSAVLLYGIGINKTTEINFFTKKDFFYLIKVILSILISSVLCYLFTDKILVPLESVELYPIVCLLIYLCITILLEAIVRLTTNKSATEFIFSYLVVLLSVTESNSLITAVIISLSCLVSIAVIIPLVYSFRKRNLENETEPEKYISRLFLFLMILFLIISVWDVMWINPEVIK
jgi:hypothetical protein